MISNMCCNINLTPRFTNVLRLTDILQRRLFKSCWKKYVCPQRHFSMRFEKHCLWSPNAFFCLLFCFLWPFQNLKTKRRWLWKCMWSRLRVSKYLMAMKPDKLQKLDSDGQTKIRFSHVSSSANSLSFQSWSQSYNLCQSFKPACAAM